MSIKSIKHCSPLTEWWCFSSHGPAICPPIFQPKHLQVSTRETDLNMWRKWHSARGNPWKSSTVWGRITPEKLIMYKVMVMNACWDVKGRHVATIPWWYPNRPYITYPYPSELLVCHQWMNTRSQSIPFFYHFFSGISPGTRWKLKAAEPSEAQPSK